jgi:DNA polymerase III sliding clamp (beta) subunit (PCNA family)
LYQTLETARGATPSAPSLTAYAGVLFQVSNGSLTITGADGEVQIEAVLVVDNAVDGDVLIAPGPLAGLLRTVDPDAVVTVTAGDELEVAIAKLQPYRLRVIHATLPAAPAPTSPAQTVDLSNLSGVLAAVRAATGREIGGIQVLADASGLHLRATDTYRLHAATLPVAGLSDFQGVVPAAVLARIAEIKPTHIAFDAHARVLQAWSSSVRITSRLLGVPFPQVESMLRSTPPLAVSIVAKDLSVALTRLQAVADSAPVSIEVTNGVARLTATNSEVGTGVEEIEAPGDDMSFAVARAFLADAVAAHSTATVTIQFTSANQAVIISSDTPFPVRCVVMPVRQ